MVAPRATKDEVLNERTAGDVRRRANIAGFRSTVWRYWRENGRHELPWRKTKNPYRIMVSEVMLQQTQVSRVKEKYKEFLKAFPTVRTLAKAPLADVLRVWSGMGYNRRAKYLRDAAKGIIEKHNGKVPRDLGALRELPGVGSYTASAVRVFAFNEPDILIETNIRAAYIHHFEKLWMSHIHISDTDILPIVEQAAKGQDPREWHWALMDYGVHIKKLHKNPARKSVHYTKQSKFEGSLRQVRGAILRELHKDPANPMRCHLIGFGKTRVEKALAGLARDGLIVKKKGKWRIA